MADRPILFSAPMIRALIDGRKSQTRRILEPQPDHCHRDIIGKPQPWSREDWGRLLPQLGDRALPVRFAKGDRLWVIETVKLISVGPGSRVGIVYIADGDSSDVHFFEPAERPKALKLTKQTPGIHMPRWASRLTLTVTNVRVERLWDIGHADAKAEGVAPFAPHRAPPGGCHDDGGDSSGFDDCARCAFKLLWARINGGKSWFENPWVVAITFSAEQANIDSLPLPYLIWSNVHDAWWGANRAGYYTSLESAGRYTREEAIAQCATGRDGFTARRTPPELPVRESAALQRGNRLIDDLVLKEDRVECRRRDLARKAKRSPP